MGDWDEGGGDASWDEPQETAAIEAAPAAEQPAQVSDGGFLPDAGPQAVKKTLEELKDEAGAWTLASDESVSRATEKLGVSHTVPLQLRLYLTDYSTRMMDRTKDIAKSVDDLLQDTEVASPPVSSQTAVRTLNSPSLRHLADARSKSPGYLQPASDAVRHPIY